MSRVIVYVEGPSDRLALARLLEPLLDDLRGRGTSVEFFEAPEGDRKESVLTRVPVRSVNILRNDPDAIVVAMPDLYPRDKSFAHQTFEEMRAGILANYQRALRAKNLDGDARLHGRFRVFCLKHDLEALILAAGKALTDRLGAKVFKTHWRVPVEDQDHDRPPKRVVSELFEECSRRYKDTVDAPIILGACNYMEIADRCPQCFKPFVEFLRAL